MNKKCNKKYFSSVNILNRSNKNEKMEECYEKDKKEIWWRKKQKRESERNHSRILSEEDKEKKRKEMMEEIVAEI